MIMQTRNVDADNGHVKPWYKEFWAWFILSPLILVVIVSSITVTIAVKNADDRVLDNYYKEGRMINMRLDEDMLAESLQMSAAITFNQPSNEVIITVEHLGPESVLPRQLLLELSHPVQAALDRSIVLSRVGNEYRARELPQHLEHKWYLRLLPIFSDKEQRRWRLKGELNFSKPLETIVLTAGV